MIKQINRNFFKKGLVKGVILAALFLLLNIFVFAKTRVDIDGSVNINFGRKRDRNGDYWGNNNNNRRYNVGDMTDSQYDSVPFILNGRGYAVFRNRGSFYILQVEFVNGNPNNVRQEQIFKANAITENCVSIAGDDKYCLTVTAQGSPALWDRYSGRIRYTGRWVGRGNYNFDYDYDYYRSNQSEHWFEW